jgi:hypothetical protein
MSLDIVKGEVIRELIADYKQSIESLESESYLSIEDRSYIDGRVLQLELVIDDLEALI